MIFNVEVIHNKKEFRNLIIEELEEYGIKKNHFRKSYKEIEKIKKEILTKYKNQIEWIEIERVGTKYIVKVEERIITNKPKQNKLRNVVAKKSGIIINVFAKRGEIVKNINDYVVKGDVIISGDLYLNEEIKNTVSAEGKVYAEVWYTVTVNYPFKYNEIKQTGKNKQIYTFKIFNKYYDLFNFKKYKTKQIINKTIFKNNLIPISFIKQKQKETIEINEIYTKKEAINKAISEAYKKISKNLNENEQILKIQIINKEIYKDKIKIKVFFSVKEDITSYQLIKEIDENKKIRN